MKKIPFVPQLNSTECGVCVLTMILHYFGAYYPMHEIRSHLPAGRDGITIRRLIQAFQLFGIQADAFHGVIDHTSEIFLPAVITWENDHYVILEYIGKKFIGIVDPNFGRVKMTLEEFNSSYSGIIILLSKTDQFHKKRRHFKIKNSFSSIVTYYRKDIVLFVFLSFLAQLFAFFVPLTIQYLIDGLLGMNFQFFPVILFAVAIILNSVFSYLKRHCMTGLGVNIDREVNKKLIAKLLKVKYNFYDTKSNAEIMYALDHVSCVKSIYLENILECIFDFLSMILVLSYLFYKNTLFFIIVIIALIPNILLLVLTDKPIQRDIRFMIREHENIYGQQMEIIYSILGIKTSSVEQPVFDRWVKNYNLYYKKNKDYETKINAFKVTLATLINLSPIIVLVLAVSYTQSGFMTMGVTMAFYAMTNMVFGSVNTILNNIRNLRDNLIPFERMEDIMNYPEESLPARIDAEVHMDGDIVIDHISFKYSKEGAYILKNISCTIPKNSKVAVIGDSGSGKSTFLKVLSGLYELDSGTILCHSNRMGYGIDASVKKQIGFVAQNVWPMNQSIEEYLLLGLTNATIEDVENACRIVNIHDEIMQMPMKYHTIISETGKNISGGQCQRIMLARMVLLKPKILLLDEATNALDIVNENKIFDYFTKKKCTIIMVTHKLEFLKNCDKILFMKNGTLVSKGKYEELVKEYGNTIIQSNL